MPRRFSRTAVSLVAAAVICGGVSLYATARSAPTGAPAPVSIALVDIQKLVFSTHEAQDRNLDLRKKGEELSAKLNEINIRMEKIRTDLDTKIPKTDYKARADLLAEFAELNSLKEARGRAFQEILDMAKGDVEHELYDHVIAAVEELAKQDGFDVVLFDDRVLGVPFGTRVQEVDRVLASRHILYARQGMDITDRVLARMNTAYDTAHPNRPVATPAVPVPAPTTPAPNR